MTRNLFTATALLEILTGLALLGMPAFIARILLGTEITMPVEFTIARVAGSGILALGITCWMARNDQRSHASKALLSGILVYHITVFASLVYYGIVSQTTVALMAALIVHFILAAGCMVALKKFNRPG